MLQRYEEYLNYTRLKWIIPFIFCTKDKKTSRQISKNMPTFKLLSADVFSKQGDNLT